MENEVEDLEKVTERLGAVLGDISSDYRSMNESLNRIELMLYQLYGSMPLREVEIDEPTTTTEPADQSINGEFEVLLENSDQNSCKEMPLDEISEHDVLEDDEMLTDVVLGIDDIVKNDEANFPIVVNDGLNLLNEFSHLAARQVFDETPDSQNSHEHELLVEFSGGIDATNHDEFELLGPLINHDKVYPKLHHWVLEVDVDLVACLELHYFDPGGKKFKLGDSLTCNWTEFLTDYASLKSTDLVASSMSSLGREPDILTAFEDENDYVRMMYFDPGGGCHSSSDFADSSDASHKLKSDEFMLKNESGETFSIFANVNPVAIDMMRIPFAELISTEESLLSGAFLDLHDVTGGKSSLWYLVFDPGISFKGKWVIETKIASMLRVALGSWKYPHSVKAQLADFAKLFCVMCLSSENESELVIHVIHFGSVINEVVAATLIVANIYGQRAALLKLFIGEEELKLAETEIPYTHGNSFISLHFQPCVSADLPLEVDLPPNNLSYKAFVGHLRNCFKLYDPGGEGYYLSDKTAVVRLYYELSFEFLPLIMVCKNFGADLELGEAKIAQGSFESVLFEFRGVVVLINAKAWQEDQGRRSLSLSPKASHVSSVHVTWVYGLRKTSTVTFVFDPGGESSRLIVVPQLVKFQMLLRAYCCCTTMVVICPLVPSCKGCCYILLSRAFSLILEDKDFLKEEVLLQDFRSGFCIFAIKPGLARLGFIILKPGLYSGSRLNSYM